MNGNHIRRVFMKYEKLLTRVSRAMLGNESDADDAVQETFLKYIAAEKKFEKEEYEKAWLLRVNINICKNMRRFRKNYIMLPLETASEHYENIEEIPLADLLGELRPKDRELIVLHYLEGYSYKEIAEMERISVDTLKKRMERARKRLAEKLVFFCG